eukprot:2204912-Prymnesium_polylepis.1
MGLDFAIGLRRLLEKAERSSPRPGASATARTYDQRATGRLYTNYDNVHTSSCLLSLFHGGGTMMTMQCGMHLPTSVILTSNKRRQATTDMLIASRTCIAVSASRATLVVSSLTIC